MRRRIEFAVTVFALILAIGLEGKAVGDVPDQLAEAEQFVKSGNYDQAEAIYRQIVVQVPDSNDALEAQKQLTCLCVTTNRLVEADTTLAELTAGFSGHKDVAQAVHDIAYHYRTTNRHDKANEIDQSVIRDWPQSDCAVLAQMDIAKYYVDQGNEAEAQPAIDELLGDLSGSPLIARALHDVGQHYRSAGKCEEANQLYQHVIVNCPGTEYAMWSQVDLVKSNLALKDDAEAEAAVEGLLGDFTKNPLIAQAIHDVGQHYRGLKKYDKANELYEHVVANCPGTEHALWSQADLIKSYLALGDDANAEAAVEGLLSGFSDNPLIARAVWDTGQHYRELKQYAQANRLYKHIVTNYPDSEHALKAQMDLVKSYLALEDEASVETAIGGLLANFSDNPLAARAVWEIGQHCRDLKEYAQANRLYQHVVANYPDSESALWAQADLIKSYLALEDDPNAEAAVEKLLTDFSDNPLISRAIHDTAYEHRKLEKYDRADQLDQFVIDNWPADEQAMWAKMDMAKTNIAFGDDAAVQAAIEDIIADFNDQPRVAEAICLIGDEYFLKKNYRKAIPIWELILSRYPGKGPDLVPYLLATSYAHLEDYDKAIEFYTEVAEKYPNCKYEYRTAYRLGLTYRRAGKYDKAIEWFNRQRTRHPENEMYMERALTGQAATYYYNLKDYQKAAETYEQYIGEFPDARRISTMYLFLARCNAKLGRKDSAEAVLEAALIKLGDSERAESLRDELAILRKGGEQ